jgi:hypothetical protein
LVAASCFSAFCADFSSFFEDIFIWKTWSWIETFAPMASVDGSGSAGAKTGLYKTLLLVEHHGTIFLS